MAGPDIRQVTHATLGAWVTLTALTGAGLAVTAVLLLVLVQPYPERGRQASRLPIFSVSLIALLTALAGQHWTALPATIAAHLAGVSLAVMRPLAIASVAAALLAMATTWRRLRDFPAGVLWEDSARADRTRLAATFLNFQMLAWIAEDGYWRRPSCGQGRGPAAAPPSCWPGPTGVALDAGRAPSSRWRRAPSPRRWAPGRSPAPPAASWWP